MVFAPAPVLTVTIERAGDDDELHVHPGGQGIWQARMLRLFDVPVTLCTTLGGEVGAVLEPALEREDLTLRTVRRDGTSGWSVHDRRGGERDEVAGAHGTPLSRHEIDELYGLALAEGLKADVSVLSGTPDPTLVPADLSGDQLAAALAGGLDFLKVSHEEAVADGHAGDESEPELVRALHSLRDAGASMTAGVAAMLAEGGDLVDAVRTGAAAGALNVTRHGLGTGRAEAIAELIGRVTMSRREDA